MHKDKVPKLDAIFYKSNINNKNRVKSPYRNYSRNDGFYQKSGAWSKFVADFAQIFKIENNKLNDSILYRGQSDPEWQIISAAERLFLKRKIDQKNKIINRMEFNLWVNSIFDEFKSKAIATEQWRDLINIRVKSRTALYCMGRHFGLINPIIDWSTSPFVAAFFAVSDYYDRINIYKNNNKPVVVYAIGPIDSNKYKIDETESQVLSQCVGENGKIWIFDNQELFIRRQFAQSGRFTILGCDKFDTGKFIIKCTSLKLFAYYIWIDGKDEALEILNSLSEMNIHYGTMFPDMEGAMRYGNFNAVKNNGVFSEKAIELYANRSNLLTKLKTSDLKPYRQTDRANLIKEVQQFQLEEKYTDCFSNSQKKNSCNHFDCIWGKYCTIYQSNKIQIAREEKN